MKIGPLDSKPPVQPSTAERRPAPEAAPPPPAEASAKVALSPAASSLSVATGDAAFDTAKVERIAQAIRDGRFKVNAEVIADKLIINAEELLSEASGCPVKMLNDADAAGIAEVKYGFAKDQKGVAMLLTIGTGIGSALFMDGKLMPNTELGHLFIRGQEAEHFAADSVRKKEKLSWDEWAQRFNEYLLHLEFLFSPSVFILGGGASKYFEQYKHNFTVKAQVVAAQFLNNAGLIGAAYYAR